MLPLFHFNFFVCNIVDRKYEQSSIVMNNPVNMNFVYIVRRVSKNIGHKEKSWYKN